MQPQSRLMFSTSLITCFSAVLLLASTLLAQDAVTAPPAKEKFHLYLLIGQSNMAGRGEMDKNQKPPARVLKFNKEGRWVPATDPLHFDKTSAGVGPGSGFGPAMAAADSNVTIGLIPSAVGGTPLSRWVKGGDLYNQALSRAKAAMKDGTLKGVIWHQGESDSGTEELAKSYGERLAGMIAALRADLEAPQVPLVVGKLGVFTPAHTKGNRAIINEALGNIPKQVPHTACVETNELKAKADGIHFDAESSRELGRRYAKAMLELQQK